MERKLASFVHLLDENGKVHSYGPGDDVPEWAQAKISNPKAWVEVEQPSAPAPEEAPVPAPAPEPAAPVESPPAEPTPPEPAPAEPEPAPLPTAEADADPELGADVEVLTKGNPDEVKAWLADAPVRRVTAALGAVEDEAARVDLANALLSLEQSDGGRNRSSLVDELSGFTN